jgi:exopolysaccharide biosynthesis polyprenyl glycosylphosphotransferase
MRTESNRGVVGVAQRTDAGMVTALRSAAGLGVPAPLSADLGAALDPPAGAAPRRRARSAGEASRASLVRRTLVIGDAAALAGAWALSATLTRAPLALFAASLPLWLALAHVYGLYDADVQRTGMTTADELGRLFHLVVVGAVALYAGAQLAGLDADPALFGVYGALALPALASARTCARAAMRRRPVYTENVVIVGGGTIGQLVAAKLIGRRGVDLVGFVDGERTALGPELADIRHIGGLDTLPAAVGDLDVDRVIVAFPSDPDADLTALLDRLEELPVQVDIVPRLLDALGPRARLHDLSGLPLVGLPPRRRSRAARTSARLLDVAGSCMLVAALAPLLIAIVIAIRLTSPGPVFYLGERIGRNGARFRLLKFRTMRIEFCRGSEYGGEDAEAAFRELMTDPAQRAQFEHAHKLADDPRVTPVGALLRRTSLDELPQLYNVLKGDLSLVGPRPITVDECSEDLPPGGYWTIPDLDPGMTGYWQINGRSSTSYEERVRLDTAYATSRSLRLDLLILARTASALLDRRSAC